MECATPACLNTRQIKTQIFVADRQTMLCSVYPDEMFAPSIMKEHESVSVINIWIALLTPSK